MSNAFVRQTGATQWSLGNDQFEIAIALTAHGEPVLSALRAAMRQSGDTTNWAALADGHAFGPTIAANGVSYQPTKGNIHFDGAEVVGADAGADAAELRLSYRCDNGLLVTHHLAPDQAEPAWRAWTVLSNPTAAPIAGITRFDALNLWLGASGDEPQVSYVLGWLDGPRADAPGHHAIPYHYPSWIPRLLYGDGAYAPPEPPPGGWSSPVLRLVQERLTKLPLQSGKRSTYDNHPWLALLDPDRQAGCFLGFEWSGSWKIDAEHFPDECAVSIAVYTDACIHTLKPGATLESPPAFMGLFGGDWDEAYSACSRYVSAAILPPRPRDFPLLTYNFGCPFLSSFDRDMSQAEAFMRHKIDVAAEAGMEDFMIDAAWWSASPLEGDFSNGLGDFADHRVKFPSGLKAVSDYVHQKGMRFGLWFEFERVDLRTANLGRNPWKPEWLVHQKGHPYRSWGQHFFDLCLGVRAAADWALENCAWAIREFGVDWFKIDSNEWAVCDDPTHDHGATDGEWAQVQGLYHVLKGLRREFPNLIIENCAGGSQRGDFGMARYSDFLACHDTNWPSAIARKYSNGASAMYPPYYGKNSLPPYSTTLRLQHTYDEWWRVAQPERVAPPDLGRLRWRALSRMLGMFETGGDFSDQGMLDLKPTFAFYKRLRPTLCGRRYVLDGPAVLRERENLEAGQWEAYEFVAPDQALASVYFFRCMSHLPEHHVVLKGLDPQATYRGEFHGGQAFGTATGAELMSAGVTCHLEQTLQADVLLLEKVS